MAGFADTPFDLTGRVALVTGSGQGLGQAIALALARAGAHLVLVGRTAAKLDATVDALRDMQLPADARTCDVTDSGAVSALVADVDSTIGPIDILVNNAGIQSRGPFAEVTDRTWGDMLSTHITAPFLLSRAIAPGMISRGRGKIINTVSVLGELGRPNVVPYSAAKGGLRMLTRSLAVELAPKNIQVNGIGPGYFRTEMNRPLLDDANYSKWIEGRVPAGRWGEPSELAGAAVFLASDASSYVNGQIIFVDGGLSISV